MRPQARSGTGRLDPRSFLSLPWVVSQRGAVAAPVLTKTLTREEPVRRSAATGPTPAISRRERAEKERAPPLHDNPKARRRGGRHTRGAAACCDARFRSDL